MLQIWSDVLLQWKPCQLFHLKTKIIAWHYCHASSIILEGGCCISCVAMKHILITLFNMAFCKQVTLICTVHGERNWKSIPRGKLIVCVKFLVSGVWCQMLGYLSAPTVEQKSPMQYLHVVMVHNIIKCCWDLWNKQTDTTKGLPCSLCRCITGL